MTGYLDDPERTAEVLVTDEAGKVWYRTGDLFSMDDEGFLTFQGRLGRQFKLSNGEFVNPERLERIFARASLIEHVLICGDQTRTFPLPVINRKYRRGTIANRYPRSTHRRRSSTVYPPRNSRTHSRATVKRSHSIWPSRARTSAKDTGLAGPAKRRNGNPHAGIEKGRTQENRRNLWKRHRRSV